MSFPDLRKEQKEIDGLIAAFSNSLINMVKRGEEEFIPKRTKDFVLSLVSNYKQPLLYTSLLAEARKEWEAELAGRTNQDSDLFKETQ